jgi:hypothetical protein
MPSPKAHVQAKKSPSEPELTRGMTTAITAVTSTIVDPALRSLPAPSPNLLRAWSGRARQLP